ncbi:MAG: antirepressor regulating drug resistance protein [Tardiphaga sp.]|uniref:M56 family metallopeptidase n=1 Tax=Tardiphaga sp. TaxID=1926292 RepID=UPI0026270140|nr:M56 family metallopeptidase [Tardiphaga sp.]MDB5501623.1 antirepressor regulating drug resistance protein [Tardiphaga sp.]
MLAILAESALRSLMLGSAVWGGLHVFRVRNPHVHMTSWAVVLLASLAMPLLMHWTTVTVPLAPSTVPIPADLWPSAASWPEPLPLSLAPQAEIPGASPVAPHHAFNWSALATAIYVIVAGLLLLRLAIGLRLTWRLARHATPLHAPWVAGADVRVSALVNGPVTFGSTILFPSDYVDWDLGKRQAVLAHESAHVANRDFYLLLLAALNRAVFWFSPFAWWQSFRLAELAEMISDARALEIVDDRLSYAQILLDLVQHVRQAPAGLQMARASTVRNRVERILDGSAGPATAGWRKRLWTAAATAPVVIVSALTIAWSTPSRSTLVTDNAADASAAARGSEEIDFYDAGSGLILAVFHDGDKLSGQLTWQRKFRLPQAQDGTVSYPSVAGPITWSVGDDRHPVELLLHQHGRDLRAARIAATAAATAADAASRESYVGWYELTPTHVLTVTRDGNRILMQDTGRSKLVMTSDAGDAFFGNDGDRVIFLRDEQAHVTRILHYDHLNGARLAPRIDAVQAKAIEADAARRMAEAPDRFRGQAPQPGSKEAVLRGIADMQNGTPNYDRMTAALAAKVRRQTSLMTATLKALGAVESIFFRGVGPGGFDIYGVKFANGLAEVRLMLAADGKVDDVLFRPDGDNTLGHILACSREEGLKSRGGTSPISVFFYNDTGQDMRLYELDAEGKRIARGTVGDDMSSTIWTTVDKPWVITDASGTCLEVVLPGLRTRFITVEGAGAVERWNSPRTTPMAGSEQMLRQYIEALGRGQPNYDQMTSQVAAYTRDQLPLNQAILGRLGALQAISFRGVSGSGNDVYMAHFANGTAEWRIGLVKDRTIGRIALGPQY